MLVDALKGILEPRCDVVGTVNNGRALLQAASTLQQEVIVLDTAMPQLKGLDAARQIKHTKPNVKLVVMTVNEDPGLVGEAFRAGGLSQKVFEFTRSNFTL
jgi:DNA-binding NarL/FixJ family response regulator